jgi:hypothetical protein
MMPDPLPTLLAYQPSTRPSPLQVGTATRPAHGVVNISVTAAAPAYCDSIMLAVPIGDTGTDLMTKRPAGSVSSTKWTVKSDLVLGRDIGLPGNRTYASVIYRCVSPTDYLIDYPLTLGLSGDIAREVGQAELVVFENSGTSPDQSTFQSRQATIGLTKTSPVFYMENFLANEPGKPTVPRTDFAAGDPIDFTWESNGTYYEVYCAEGGTAPMYAGTDTRFSLPGGANRDTTFTLIASVGAALPEDAPGFDRIRRTQALTITVRDPVLAPKSIDVAGATTLAAVKVDGTLTVDGELIANNRVTVDGELIANERVTVDGELIAGEGLTIKGTLTAREKPVAVQGAGVLVYNKVVTGAESFGVTAPTDGFLVAQVVPNQKGYANPGLVQLSSGAVVLKATDGAVGMPVSKGAAWSFYCENHGSRDGVPIQLSWFPAGG